VQRFLSVDPLAGDYPHYTPFQYAGNKPIRYIDLDGLEEAEADPGEIGKMFGELVVSARTALANIMMKTTGTDKVTSDQCNCNNPQDYVRRATRVTGFFGNTNIQPTFPIAIFGFVIYRSISIFGNGNELSE